MNNIELEFFDEYKELDQLCKNILLEDIGVTEYINQMEEVPELDRRKCASWQTDYRMLKHLRWIRNNIAHSNSNSGCTRKDIEDVKRFRKRILMCEDPFSVIYQNNKTSTAKPQSLDPTTNYANYQVKKNYHYYRSNNSSGSKHLVWLFGFILIVIIMVVAFMLYFGYLGIEVIF